MKFFVVAELGVAYEASMFLAVRMIESAAEAGCDAVKFQLFTEKQIENSDDFDVLKKMVLTKTDCMELKETAEKFSVEFFASAMYPEAVDLLKDLGCSKVKIRCKDSKNEFLLNHATASGMLVLLSEENLPEKFLYRYHPLIRHMYCVPKYPPRLNELDLNYAKHFEGFSDHYPNIECSLCYAATVIPRISSSTIYVEKHVKLDNECLDSEVAIDFNQLKQLVKSLRIIEQIRSDSRG